MGLWYKIFISKEFISGELFSDKDWSRFIMFDKLIDPKEHELVIVCDGHSDVHVYINGQETKLLQEFTFKAMVGEFPVVEMKQLIAQAKK